MKTRLIFTLFALTLAFMGCAHAPKTLQEQEAPLVGTFKVNRYVLPNGLKLLVVEDHSSPTFAYQTWFKVGSRNEVPTRTGLAHLFEHLMFKASKNYKEGEFDRILEGAGAEGENAFTSWDYTVYVQELPKEKLDLIAKLESERMVNLVVNDASFKTEREVVQNERRYRNENSPDGMMWQELFEEAFKKHSYHWPVIGYQRDLDAMTAQDAMNFYRAYYSPNHATVVVVGDVDAGKVLQTVSQYYGALASSESPPHDIPAEPAQTAARSKQIKLNISVEKLIMGYHIPSANDPDFATLSVLDSLLSNGKSSRLYRALVDTGIASTVGTDNLEDKDPILFAFEATLQKGKKAKQAEQVILSELKKLALAPPTQAELDRARNRANFGFYEDFSRASGKANFLGRYETISDTFEKGIQIHDQMQKVTPAQIQAVVKKYFQPNQRSVVMGVRK